VHRTNANIYAQVIDDVEGKTLCSASTLGPEFKAHRQERAAPTRRPPHSAKLVGKRAI
jgi:large subunit ribosomal protein L18